MSQPKRQHSGADQRGDGTDAARAAKVRRSAWLLAGLAVLIYAAYMVWFMLRGGG